MSKTSNADQRVPVSVSATTRVQRGPQSEVKATSESDRVNQSVQRDKATWIQETDQVIADITIFSSRLHVHV